MLLGILLFTLFVSSYGRPEGFADNNLERSQNRRDRQQPLQEPNGQQRKKLNDTISTLNSLPAQVMGASLETAKELHKQWHAEDPNL